MRWLGIKLLHVLKGILVICYVFVMYVFYATNSDETPTELSDYGILTGFFIVSVIIIEAWQASIRRKLLKRPYNVTMPKPPPVIMPKPEPLPAAPQKPAARRLAPPPMVEAGEAVPVAAGSSLPANLRQFVEQGEQTIVSQIEESK